MAQDEESREQGSVASGGGSVALEKRSTMTKKKLIELISQDERIRANHAEVRHVVQAFLDKITACLEEGGRLEFRDFGVFEVVERKQKVGRNPKKADDPIVIPARCVVKFTPGKRMKERIMDACAPGVCVKDTTFS